VKVSAWAYIHCVINRKNSENGHTFEELKQKKMPQKIYYYVTIYIYSLN